MKRKVGIVGKGLTFDSGGYNLKAGAGWASRESRAWLIDLNASEVPSQLEFTMSCKDLICMSESFQLLEWFVERS